MRILQKDEPPLHLCMTWQGAPEKGRGGWGGGKCEMPMNPPQNLILHFAPPGFWIIHPTLHFQQLLGQLNNYHNLTQLPAYEIPVHPPKTKHPFESLLI